MQLNEVVQQAAQAKFPFHMQDILNGIGLNAAQHMGSHPVYTIRVTAALKEIKDRLGANFNPQSAYDEIVLLTNKIKAAIAANPNTPIDQLIF